MNLLSDLRVYSYYSTKFRLVFSVNCCDLILVGSYRFCHFVYTTFVYIYLQTLLVQCWYPMTVATNSRAQKQIIAEVFIYFLSIKVFGVID